VTAQTKRRGVIVAVMTCFISFIVFGIVVVQYVTRSIEQSTQRQCTIIELSTQPRPVPPVPPFAPTEDPTSQYGRDLDTYIKAKDKYDKELEQFNITAGKALRDYSEQIGCAVP
jgi:hypothetical protein